MDCSAARERIQDWLDMPGEPVPPIVGEHLRTCTDCRAFLAAWNGVELGLQRARVSGPRPPADLAAAVLARCALAREERRTAAQSYVRLALVGAALLLVCLLARFVGPARVPTSRAVSAMAAGTRAAPTPPQGAAAGSPGLPPVP